MLRHASARGLDAGRFARLLAIMRRPWRIAEAVALVPGRQFEQRLDRSDVLVDARVRIADACESIWHCDQREVGRIATLDLVPRERCRYARVGFRPDRVRRGDGAVFGVL